MEHFNQLSPAEAERLALLAEECSEVVQVIGKILRHGYESHHPAEGSPTNRRLLEEELGHVRFAVALMSQSLDVAESQIAGFTDEKRRSCSAYLHHNRAWVNT